MKISIVGGGISGLVCGIYSLKNNDDVTIYEKNDTLGGINQYNYFNNYFIYDKDIPFYEEIGIKDLACLNINNEEDDYLINYKDLYLYKDINKLEKHLKERDINSSKTIDSFIKDIQSAYQYLINYDEPIDLLSFTKKTKFILSRGKSNKILNKHSKENIREYLDMFKDDDLKILLRSVLPSDYPAAYLLIFIAYYQMGKIIKIKNKNEIINALQNKYTSLGGKVKYGTEILKFTYKRSKIVGMWTNSDKYIETDVCICTNDPYNVFKKILEGKHDDRKYTLRYEEYKKYPMYSYLSFVYELKSPINLAHDFILDINKMKIAASTHSYLKISVNENLLNVNIRLNNDDYFFLKVMAKNPKVYDNEITNISQSLQKTIIKSLKNLYDDEDLDVKLSLVSYLDPLMIEKKYNHYQGNVSGFGIIPGNERHISDGRLSGLNALYLASKHNACPAHLLSEMIEAKNVVLRMEKDLK